MKECILASIKKKIEVKLGRRFFYNRYKKISLTNWNAHLSNQYQN